MRTIVMAAFLLLTGCGQTGPAGPQGPMGSMGPQGPGGTFDPTQVYALQFPPTAGNPTQSHVNHGAFWVPGTTLTNSMFWRMWIRQADGGDNGGYVISDGYGGAHALLLNAGGAGNISFSPAGTVSYGCDDLVPAGQWYELAVGIISDGGANPGIVPFVNGIACGFTPIPSGNTRQAPNAGGNGTLYVGGSTHLNWDGAITMLEAWDQTSPYGTTIANYAPERFYTLDGASTTQPDLLVDYTYPQSIIADLSWGYAGGPAPTLTNRYKHPGTIQSNGTYANDPNYGLPGLNPIDYPLPTWVATTGGPWTRSSAPTAPGGRTLMPPATPADAKIFDSFSRQDSTYAYSERVSLGSTESGSLGPLTWQQAPITGNTNNMPDSFGIFNGRAVMVTKTPSIAWVNNDSADMTVSVDNYGSGHFNLGLHTAVAFRVQDAGNFWRCDLYALQGSGPMYLSLARFAGGAQQPTNAVNDPHGQAITGHHTLTAITSGTSITCQVDDGSAYKVTVTDASLQTATGAGLLMADGNEPSGLSRWDNFTVK